MKKLIVVLMLSILFTRHAEAQFAGIRACAFPVCTAASEGGATGCSDGQASTWNASTHQWQCTSLITANSVQDQQYAPTTAADWTAWTAATIDTLKHALDALSTGMRSVYTGLFGGYDYVVDLTNGITWKGAVPYVGIDGTGAMVTTGATTTFASNKCVQMQGAFNTWLVDNAHPKRIMVVGDTTITNAMFVKSYSGYNLCFGLLPSDTIGTDGYPTLSASVKSEGGSDQFLDIRWENVRLQVAMTGQTVPSVLWQEGAAYSFGHASNVSTGDPTVGDIPYGVRESGRIEVYRTDAVTWADANQGRIVRSSLTQLFESATTFVGVLFSGIQRSDKTALEVYLWGSATDHDDIGAVLTETWGTNYGPWHLSSWGNAVRMYNNVDGFYPGWYVDGNDVGIVLGDPRVGGDLPVSSSCLCASGACGGTSTCTETTLAKVGGADFENLITESDPYGQMIGFDVGDIRVGHLISEATSSALKRHQFLFGAGQCYTGTYTHDLATGDGTATDSGTDAYGNTSHQYATCAMDAECSVGTCAITASATAATQVIFADGAMTGDGGWTGAAQCTGSAQPQPCCTAAGVGATCKNYDGLAIGKAASHNDTNSTLVLRDMTIATSTGTGTPAKYAFGADTALNHRTVVRLEGTKFLDAAEGLLPYPAMSSADEVEYQFDVNDAGTTGLADTSVCVPKASPSPGNLVTCNTAGGTDFTTDYPILRPPLFYTRIMCIPYSTANWAASPIDYIRLSVQEITGSAGAGTVGGNIGTYLQMPNDITTPTQLTAFTRYTKTNQYSVPAGNIQGSSSAMSFRLHVYGGVDGGTKATLKAHCTVSAFPIPYFGNVFGYGVGNP